MVTVDDDVCRLFPELSHIFRHHLAALEVIMEGINLKYSGHLTVFLCLCKDDFRKILESCNQVVV